MSVLYKLLRKDVEFFWSSECQKVFEESKTYLLKHRVLALYDPKKPLGLYADASPHGCSSILVHFIDGTEKPILFASCTLNESEKHYSQLHREALAIIFGIRKFHKYIYGLKFQLFSDHEPLKEIFNPKKSNSSVAIGRLKRWSVILSMYDHEIKFRPGRLMGHVDALSRLPLGESSHVPEDGMDCVNFFNEGMNLHRLRDH